MAGEPTLYARMELRLTEFEKKLARATSAADKTMGNIERRGAKMTANLNGLGTGAFGGLVKGAALALAPILSVQAAIRTVTEGLQEFGDISDNAKASGLDAEFFQELAYQAGLGGVAMDALSGALNTFSKNSGLAVVNKGKMVAALKALNPELLANIQAATTQEERVRLAADAIAAAGSASEKAALSTALFGDAGAKLADVFSGGSAQIDNMAAAAKKLGIIVDRDLIARADAMGDEFDTATKVMDLQFKQALIDLAPALIATANLAGGLAAAIGDITEQMQSLGQRGTATLEAELKTLDDRAALKPSSEAPGVDPMMENYPEMQAADNGRRAEIMAELKKRAMDELRLGLGRLPRDTGDDNADAGASNAAAEAAIKHGDAVKKLIADLQFEKQTIGETGLEQNILNTLRSAGVDATSAEGLAIRGLITDLDAQKTAIQANAEAMENLKSIGSDAIKGFVSDLRQGKDAGEAFSGALEGIGERLLDMALNTAITGLFSMIGNAFLPGVGGAAGGGLGHLFGFADGGPTGPSGFSNIERFAA